MASEKKSTDAFEAAIKRELQSASRTEAHDCPAPDVLAAYYDRSLSRGERVGVDAHLMSCARCQSMMAAIARADDSQPSLPARETVRGFFQVARVAAPIAVIGATLAFMVGMRTRAQHALQVAALASPAAQPQAEVVERAIAPASPPSAAGEKSAPIFSHPYIASEAGSVSGSHHAAGLHHHKVQSLQAPALAHKETAPQQLAKAEASPTVMYPSAVFQPPVESFETAASAPGEPPAQAAAAGGAPAIVARNETAAAGAAVSASTAMGATVPTINRTTSPDGSVMWQFGTGGLIMRSENSGAWATLHSGVTSDLLAASAPSADVCWMVGKSATVLRTLDRGTHWQIVTPPSREDFTMVTASDSNNATVVASSGNRYVTRDGGVTWSSP